MNKRILFPLAVLTLMSTGEVKALCVKPLSQKVAAVSNDDIVNGVEATVARPAYVSDSLKNAACTSLEGWTTHVDKNKVGKTNEWEVASGNYTSEDGTFVVTDYIQRYRGSAGIVGLSNSNLSQTIENMPKGIYQVSADLLANITTNLTTNVDGYHGVTFAVSASGKSYSTPVATLHDKPTRKTGVVVVGDDGKMSIEFATNGTNCNWIFISNIQLEYLGEGCLSLIDLYKSMTTYNDSLSTLTSDDKCNASVKSSLENAIAYGQTLIDGHSNDSVAIDSAMKSFAPAWQAIKDNIEAYQELAQIYQELTQALKSMDVKVYPGVAELKNFLDGKTKEYPISIKNIYRNCSYTTEELEAYENVLDSLYDKAVKSGVTPGRDVTADLIDNPSFEEGSEGWDGLEGEGIAVSADYQNAEAYQATFDVYQVITDIPNGYYELTAQALQRVADNATAYEKHINEKEEINAYLYGNNDQVKLKSVYDDYMTTPSAEQGYNADWKPAGEDNVYYANSMQGFKKATDEGLYNNILHVKVTDGTLRFGVKCDSVQAASSWAIFDNFKLKYLGTIDSYTLNENEVNYFVPTDSAHVNVICSLESAAWNTFCVPFAISNATVKELFGENTQLRSFIGAEGNTLHFEHADSIEAGKAYLIKPENSVHNMEFDNVIITENPNVMLPETVSNYMFVGVYDYTPVPANSSILTITTEGKIEMLADTITNLLGLHAFIMAPSKVENIEAIVLDLGGDVTLGIRDLKGTSVMSQSNRIYNINGQLVGNSQQGLRKGVYVIDGHKVVIR